MEKTHYKSEESIHSYLLQIILNLEKLANANIAFFYHVRAFDRNGLVFVHKYIHDNIVGINVNKWYIIDIKSTTIGEEITNVVKNQLGEFLERNLSIEVVFTDSDSIPLI